MNNKDYSPYIIIAILLNVLIGMSFFLSSKMNEIKCIESKVPEHWESGIVGWCIKNY